MKLEESRRASEENNKIELMRVGVSRISRIGVKPKSCSRHVRIVRINYAHKSMSKCATKYCRRVSVLSGGHAGIFSLPRIYLLFIYLIDVVARLRLFGLKFITPKTNLSHIKLRMTSKP